MQYSNTIFGRGNNSTITINFHVESVILKYLQHSNRAYNLFLSVPFTPSLRYHILHTCRNKLKIALLRIESKQKKINEPPFVSRLGYYASYVYDIYCSYFFTIFFSFKENIGCSQKEG